MNIHSSYRLSTNDAKLGRNWLRLQSEQKGLNTYFTRVNFVTYRKIITLAKGVSIRHRRELESKEIRPAMFSGIVTGDAPVSHWPIFCPCLQ